MPRLLHIDRNDLLPQILYIKLSFGYSNLNLVYFLSKIPPYTSSDWHDRPAGRSSGLWHLSQWQMPEEMNLRGRQAGTVLFRCLYAPALPFPWGSEKPTNKQPFPSPFWSPTLATNIICVQFNFTQQKQCHNRPAKAVRKLLKISLINTNLAQRKARVFTLNTRAFPCKQPPCLHGGLWFI